MTIKEQIVAHWRELGLRFEADILEILPPPVLLFWCIFVATLIVIAIIY